MRIRFRLITYYLDSNLSIDTRIFRQIDLAHTTIANAAHKAVMS
jgi:hypothetical protein